MPAAKATTVDALHRPGDHAAAARLPRAKRPSRSTSYTESGSQDGPEEGEECRGYATPSSVCRGSVSFLAAKLASGIEVGSDFAPTAASD